MLDYKKVQKILLVILEGLIYLSFLMPFIFINDSIFPFIVGKILYFQSIVQLMAAIYILLLCVNYREFKPKKTLLLYWLGFYAVTLLLSAAFGIDFGRAFWSNFERMTGVFVVFHCIAYSIIVSSVFNTSEKIKRAIKVLLGVSLIQVAVVLAQYVKPGVFLYENKGGRVWGTLGNSIYVGSYFLFHIFFALYLTAKEKKQIWQIIYLAITFLETYIIIHSESSRGADLAFLFAVFFIIFTYAFLSKNKKIRLAAGVILTSGVLLLGILFIFRQSVTVLKMPLVGGMLNSSLSAGTGRTRVIAWEIAWEAFKEKPILGWGLENYYYLFNKHYNPESLRYSYYETWFDRSHSIIFDTLSSGGAVGMVSYFGLFAVSGYLLFASWRKGKIDKHTLIFFPVILGTYLIQILFVFDHPASYFLLYFVFGLILSMVSEKREPTEPKYGFSWPVFSLVICLVLTGFLILFFSTSIKTYKAAVGIINAEKIFVNNYKEGIAAYRDILAMKTPFIDDMRSVMAKRVGQVSPAFLESNPGFREAILFARNEMLKESASGDIDVYNYIILGQIDMLLAASDPQYYYSADDFFAKARDLSPKRQQIYYIWARNKLMEGDAIGAENLLKSAVSFDEEIAESYWYLGLIYDNQGKKELAWENIVLAVEKHYSWKAQNEFYFAIDLGEKLKKYNELPVIYKSAISFSPSADLYGRLGNVYLRLGDKIKAEEAFSNATTFNPEIFKKQ